MTTLPAPFGPLVSGAEGLDRYPTQSADLAGRMSQIYGVPVDHVLPVRGVTHGLELVWRAAAREGRTVRAPEGEPYASLARLYAVPDAHAAVAAEIVRAEDAGGTDAAERSAAPLLVIDAGFLEFSPDLLDSQQLSQEAGVVLLRSLSHAYGLAGARIGAAVGRPEILARLAQVMEPHALPLPSVRLAQQAIAPSRMVETTERIAAVAREHARITAALAPSVAVAGSPPRIELRPSDVQSVIAQLLRFGVPFERTGDALRLQVFARAELNNRLLAALGRPPAELRPHRVGEAVRDTRETQIVCAVNLDQDGPVKISTGVGFFDHMLEQVAAHGGFSLRLACEGDLHIDPHHTVEDCAIALGQALRQALGERRGIARYGFVLPMDEAQARVSIDLSGRPYPVFEGEFSTPLIGDYRTDLTAHVFRSLAEHLGAAIQISVTGEDDHHKTEAVYKGFGRALRQAIRQDGDAVPSTKGVL